MSLAADGRHACSADQCCRILSTIIAAPIYEPQHSWWNGEQTALGMAGSNNELTDSIAIVPPHWFNADMFGTFQPNHQFKTKIWYPGDFACHLMVSCENCCAESTADAYAPLPQSADSALHPC